MLFEQHAIASEIALRTFCIHGDLSSIVISQDEIFAIKTALGLRTRQIAIFIHPLCRIILYK